MNRNQLKKEITCVNECAEFTLVFQTEEEKLSIMQNDGA